MEFKTRQSGVFIMNMILVLFALFMAWYTLMVANFVYKLLQFTAFIWLAVAYIRFRIYYRYVVLIIKGKPVLTVNEISIYDAAKEIEYFWQDIDEIYEENAYLYLKLDNQKDYLDRIKNPFKRFITGFSGTPPRINIDMVNVDPNVLLDILDNYSIKAETSEILPETD